MFWSPWREEVYEIPQNCVDENLDMVQVVLFSRRWQMCCWIVRSDGTNYLKLSSGTAGVNNWDIFIKHQYENKLENDGSVFTFLNVHFQLIRFLMMDEIIRSVLSWQSEVKLY